MKCLSFLFFLISWQRSEIVFLRHSAHVSECGLFTTRCHVIKLKLAGIFLLFLLFKKKKKRDSVIMTSAWDFRKRDFPLTLPSLKARLHVVKQPNGMKGVNTPPPPFSFVQGNNACPSSTHQ